MTYKEKMVLAAEMINEGKTYRDVANAMQYKSEGSVSRVIRDAKTQGLIKTGSEWEREVLAEKERADKAEALAQKLLDVLGRVIPNHLVGRLELNLDSVPEATVVRGEWKLYGNDDDSGMSYWCTVCNFQLSEDLFYSGYKNGRWIENGVFKYCPNCGAKMEVPGDE
jgi:hypothetical protein